MGNETVTKENDVMKTLKKREKSKKKRIILIVVLAVVVFLGVNIVNGVNRAQEAMQEAMATMQTGEVSTRSLIKSVGATGTITSIESKSITAAISNVEVKDVMVEIGDTVTEGQELLYFDTTDIEESLANAEKTLSNSSTVNSITKEEAEKNLEKTIENYDKQVEAAEEDLENHRYAEIADYLYNVDKGYITPNPDTDVQTLREEMEREKADYEKKVEAYEEALESRESGIESAKNNYTTSTIRLNTTTEKNQVELYEEQLAEGIVTAPISGIVTALNFEEGDTYVQGSPLITIQDCSAFEVEAYIGEYDISDIEKGQKVLIKTDATGDKELEGTVVFVSPTAAASMTGGDVTYLVRISVDTPNDRLRLDMSASLSIIIEQHENALTVPYNAVQEDEQGNTYVEVMAEDGTTTKVPVTVVLESNYYTEIKSDDLTEGQKVRIIEAEGTNIFEMMGGRGGF
ncbi:MAG: efflux RND transporter periplasmic adaptor subunit [Roseburia sp.]|nr:efflux RND transporter periplasmic adaptor subunit [Roseburia sp.]